MSEKKDAAPKSERYGKKSAEAWAEEKATPAWLHASAKVMHRWPQGKMLDEAEYAKALEAVLAVRIGG
jgi:hypothetical protein